MVKNKIFIMIVSIISIFSFQIVNAEFIGDFVYLNNVENPSSIDDIKSHLTVFDDLDGIITDSIFIKTDNYTGNENILGDFIIVFAVVDSNNSESSAAIIVRNVDVTPPQLTLTKEDVFIQIGDTLVNNVSAVCYDTYKGQINEILINDSDTFVLENYVDVNTSADYEVTYKCSDGYNISEKTVTYHVTDLIAPVISGVSEIIKSSDYILTLDSILALFTTSDNYNEEIELEIISNQYVGNANIPGSYEIELRAVDSYGNIDIESLTIKVVNNIVPFMIIDKENLYINTLYKLTENDIINAFRNIGEIVNSDYINDVRLDNYSSNYDTVGSYDYDIKLIASSGEEYLLNLNINVINYDNDVLLENPSNFDNFKETAIDFIKDFWLVIVIIALVIIGIIVGNKKDEKNVKHYR